MGIHPGEIAELGAVKVHFIVDDAAGTIACTRCQRNIKPEVVELAKSTVDPAALLSFMDAHINGQCDDVNVDLIRKAWRNETNTGV